MKERPILFSGPMVRAILDGRKTQTRRVVSNATSQGNYRASDLLLDDSRTFADGGPSPIGNPGPYLHAHVNAPEIERRHGWEPGGCDPEIVERLYPRHFPGDRLWVRESFRCTGKHESDGFPVYFRADATGIEDAIQRCGWRPSIHMPRWASRITLEVTGVRVERVTDITNGDAFAEGCKREPCSTCDELGEDEHGNPCDDCFSEGWFSERDQYRLLWNSLNAKRGYGWDVNPWVFVIEFKRLTNGETP